VGFQIPASAGIAMLFTATMPSVLAPLEEKDVAVAAATYSFIRSFGMIWGVTIAGMVFNSQIESHLDLIQDKGLRKMLSNGAAYAFAAREGGLLGLQDARNLAKIVELYVRALRPLWLVAMAVALLSFLCVPMERSLELKKDHTTEYGMVERGKKNEEAL
jgi:hypothetical protein